MFSESVGTAVLLGRTVTRAMMRSEAGERQVMVSENSGFWDDQVVNQDEVGSV